MNYDPPIEERQVFILLAHTNYPLQSKLAHNFSGKRREKKKVP